MEYDFDVQNGNIAVNEGRMITQDDEDCCVIWMKIQQKTLQNFLNSWHMNRISV